MICPYCHVREATHWRPVNSECDSDWMCAKCAFLWDEREREHELRNLPSDFVDFEYYPTHQGKMK
jgi:hypothetical protein